MPISPIKINIDPPNKIADLHGVGIVLANRICNYRENNGFFRSPDDLARVDGINLEFAIMLGTQIDWQLPMSAEPIKNRSWINVLILSTSPVFLLGILLVKTIPNIFLQIGYYQAGYHEQWVWVWINTSILFALSFEIIREIGFVIRETTTNKILVSNIEKSNFFLFGMFLLFMLSSGLGHATYYELYAEKGWLTFLNNPGYMLGLLTVVNSVMLMGPRILVFYNHKLASSTILGRIFDVGVTISALLQSGFVYWLFRDETPIWLVFFAALFGVLSLFMGYQTLRYGTSFFTYAIQFDSTEDSSDETSIWMKWINIRLPDPEQQKALKLALEKSYPPSKLRTVMGAIVFGAGGWLLITVLTSLVDWLLQNWLNSFFK